MSNDSDGSKHNVHVIVRFYHPKPEPPIFPSSLYPAPDPPLPPAIYHIAGAPTAPTSLSLFIAKNTALPLSLATDLIPFGAVYVQPSTDLRSARNPIEPSRTTTDISIKPFCSLYVRVFASPRRFIPPYPIRTIYNDKTDIIIISKPPDLPTTPTTDNIRECAIQNLREILHRNQYNQCMCLSQRACTTSLHPCSRLDIPTTGLIFFTTSPEATSHFHKHPPTKTYLALTHHPLPPTYLHHLYRKDHPCFKARRPYTSDPTTPPILLPFLYPHEKYYVPASLQVLSCITLDDDYYELRIRLLTGRTHQIRIQLAAEGVAIVGDTKYGKAAGKIVGKRNVELGQDPEMKMGLHAAEIEFEWKGEKKKEQAELPWWRKNRMGGLNEGKEVG